MSSVLSCNAAGAVSFLCCSCRCCCCRAACARTTCCPPPTSPAAAAAASCCRATCKSPNKYIFPLLLPLLLLPQGYLRITKSLFFGLAAGNFEEVKTAFSSRVLPGGGTLHGRLVDLTLGMMHGPNEGKAQVGWVSQVVGGGLSCWRWGLVIMLWLAGLVDVPLALMHGPNET